MAWRLALIDSCGHWPGARDAAAFASAQGRVEVREPEADSSGHGTGIAERILNDVAAGDDASAGEGAPAVELLLAQVFLGRAPTTAAAVAGAIDWSLAHRANLLHLSLGLTADRAILREAVGRAVQAGVVLVASLPARGGAVYPAAYAGVIGATGDARCAPGEISQLGPRSFGGCAQGGRGASFGAAWVTRQLLEGPVFAGGDAAVAALAARAKYRGAERRAESAVAFAGAPK